MGPDTRKATFHDVPRLWELRRESIQRLAPKGMTIAQSEAWAASMTIQGMEKRFRDAEVWLAEANGVIVGWVAVRGDYIDGLYTDPQFAGRGIGSELLTLAEKLMCERGIEVARLESSVNAEQFYLRRGYQPTGTPPADNAIPLTKQLSKQED